jgi:hypothetical protein
MRSIVAALRDDRGSVEIAVRASVFTGKIDLRSRVVSSSSAKVSSACSSARRGSVLRYERNRIVLCLLLSKSCFALILATSETGAERDEDEEENCANADDDTRFL